MNGIITFLLLLLFVVLGALYCFGGYKYLKIVMFFYAFFAVMTFVYSFVENAFPDLGIGALIISLVLGLIAGALVLFFVKLAIFVSGGILGIALFSLVRILAPELFISMDSTTVLVVSVVCFIVMGALMLAFQKHLLIIFSAVFGGYSLVYYAGILVGTLFQPEVLSTVGLTNFMFKLEPYSIFANNSGLVMLVPVLVFSILGIIAQYRFSSRKKR